MEAKHLKESKMQRNKPLTYGNILKGIALNLCPYCFQGHVFLGIYKMNASCPHCGVVFEKEPGYFMGAVIAAYFIGAFSVVPTIIICIFILQLDLLFSLGMGCAQIIALHPFLYRYSKLAWIFIENRMTDLLDG